MINKTYLHPVTTSDYSKSVSSFHVLASHTPSNKISPYLKLKLLVLSSAIFYPLPYSPKNLFKSYLCYKTIFCHKVTLDM